MRRSNHVTLSPLSSSHRSRAIAALLRDSQQNRHLFPRHRFAYALRYSGPIRAWLFGEKRANSNGGTSGATDDPLLVDVSSGTYHGVRAPLYLQRLTP